MAKPLDTISEHGTTAGGGGDLAVTSHGKLPKVCEDQMERLFRAGDPMTRRSEIAVANTQDTSPLWLTNTAKAI